MDWIHMAEKRKKRKTILSTKNLRRYKSAFEDEVLKWVMWMKKLCPYTLKRFIGSHHVLFAKHISRFRRDILSPSAQSMFEERYAIESQ